MDLKHIYEYLDIIDSRRKLEEIEKKAKKNDVLSWSILVKELKEKVIMDHNIKEFILKTEENNKLSNIYYNTINVITDHEHEKINKNNNYNFIELKNKVVLENMKNKHFYKIQKEYIYKDIKMIKLLVQKLHIENNNKVEILLKDKFQVLFVRANYLKLYYKDNTDIISHEDNLIMDFEELEDIFEVNDFIENNNKIYLYNKLPGHINIKEINKKPILYYCNSYTLNIYINIVNKYIFKEYFKNNKTYILPILYHCMYNRINSYLNILKKQKRWLIYIYNKNR